MSEKKSPQKDTLFVKGWKWFRDRFGFALCLVICIAGGYIALRAFLQGSEWDTSWPAKHDQWGQYGDFVGGVLGTIVALFSVYFLIKTLRAQQKANDDVLEDNKRRTIAEKVQQLDNSYNQLIDLYHESIKGYKEGGKQGREAIKEKVEKLYAQDYNAQTEYEERVKDARKLFEKEFYTNNRINAAVHFRILYRIFDLIEHSGLNDKEEKIKVKYAKLVRCQLDEYELVLLRYNCGCIYGKAMREHINHYNLLKHLPPLSILEFKYWHDKIKEQSHRNALDAELIAQRKWILSNIGDTDINADFEPIYISHISQRYELHLYVMNDKTVIEYILIRHNSNVSEDAIDLAYDTLGDENTINFIKDFLNEVFLYSNFEIFNNKEQLDFIYDLNPYRVNNDTYMKVCVKSKSNRPIYTRYKDYKSGQQEMPVREHGMTFVFFKTIFNCLKQRSIQQNQLVKV